MDVHSSLVNVGEIHVHRERIPADGRAVLEVADADLWKILAADPNAITPAGRVCENLRLHAEARSPEAAEEDLRQQIETLGVVGTLVIT